MDIYELKEKIKLGLNGSILDTGDHLNTILTPDQINDIANNISYYLPKTINAQMIHLQYELLGKIGQAATTERLHGDPSAVILPSDTVKDMKHKVFALLYTLNLLGENIDNTFDELFAFYRSFLIHGNDIKKEVEANPVSATTYFINEQEAVRLHGNTGKLVPTTKTLKQFKNLL